MLCADFTQPLKLRANAAGRRLGAAETDIAGVVYERKRLTSELAAKAADCFA